MVSGRYGLVVSLCWCAWCTYVLASLELLSQNGQTATLLWTPDNTAQLTTVERMNFVAQNGRTINDALKIHAAYLEYDYVTGAFIPARVDPYVATAQIYDDFAVPLSSANVENTLDRLIQKSIDLQSAPPSPPPTSFQPAGGASPPLDPPGAGGLHLESKQRTVSQSKSSKSPVKEESTRHSLGTQSHSQRGFSALAKRLKESSTRGTASPFEPPGEATVNGGLKGGEAPLGAVPLGAAPLEGSKGTVGSLVPLAEALKKVQESAQQVQNLEMLVEATERAHDAAFALQSFYSDHSESFDTAEGAAIDTALLVAVVAGSPELAMIAIGVAGLKAFQGGLSTNYQYDSCAEHPELTDYNKLWCQYANGNITLYADLAQQLSKVDYKLLLAKNAGQNQIQINSLLTSTNQQFVTIYNAMAGLGQLDTDQANNLTAVLNKNADALEQLNATTQYALHLQVDLTVSIGNQTTLVQNLLATASQNVAQAQGLLSQQRLFLTQNILSLQELVTLDQIQGESYTTQAVQAANDWRSLQAIAIEMLTQKRLYLTLSQVAATMMQDIVSHHLIPFVEDPGHAPLNVPAQDRYIVLRDFVFFYSLDGSTVYRAFVTVHVDSVFFAYDTLPRDSYTSVNQWMGPAGCGNTPDGPTPTQPPTSNNFTCNVYTTVIIESTTDASAQYVLNTPIGSLDPKSAVLQQALQQPHLDAEDAPYLDLVSANILTDDASFQAFAQALCLTPVSRMRLYEDAGQFVSDIWLDSNPFPNLKTRPFCDTTAANVLANLALYRVLNTSPSNPRLITIPFAFYDGLTTSMQNLQSFFLSVAELTAGACPTPLYVESTRATYGTMGQGINPNNVVFGSVATNTSSPVVMYTQHSLPVMATSPNAIPLDIIDNKQMHLVVTFNDTSDVTMTSSFGTSKIASVQLLNDPFGQFPRVWNWAGHKECILMPCPQRVLTLNATTGRILSVQATGDNATNAPGNFFPATGTYRMVWDIDPKLLVISRLNPQRMNTPGAIMEFVESTFTGLPNNVTLNTGLAQHLTTQGYNASWLGAFGSNAQFVNITQDNLGVFLASALANQHSMETFANLTIAQLTVLFNWNKPNNGYQFQRPVTTFDKLQAATGTSFDPRDATVSASTYQVPLVWSPQNNVFDYKCGAHHGTSQFGPCTFMDLCYTQVRLAEGRIRCYPRAPYQMKIVVQIPGNVSIPQNPLCPTSIQVIPRSVDSNYASIQTTQALPSSVTIQVRASSCSNTSTLVTGALGGALPASGPGVFVQNLPETLTLYQTYKVDLPTCNNMQVEVYAVPRSGSSGSGSSTRCYRWTPSGPSQDLSIDAIPTKVKQNTLAVRNDLVDDLRQVALDIQSDMSSSFAGTVTSIEQLYTHLQADAFSVYVNTNQQIQNQLQQRLSVIAANIAAIKGATNSELALLRLIQQAASLSMPTLDEILRYQAFLKQENIVAQDLLQQLNQLIPAFAAAVNQEFQVTQAMANANFFVSGAPPAFNWSDVTAYIGILSTLPCPASYTPPDTSDLFCNVNPFNPYSWIVDGLNCIQGYNIGWRYLILVFFFNLAAAGLMIGIIYDFPCGRTCQDLQKNWLKRPQMK